MENQNIPALDQAIPAVAGIAKNNLFRIGDAVAHPSSKQRGIVVDVRHDWVKFQVIGIAGYKGKPVKRRFSYRKLVLLATQAQIMQGYAQHLEAQKKLSNQPSPWGKFVQWAKSQFSSAPDSGKPNLA